MGSVIHPRVDPMPRAWRKGQADCLRGLPKEIRWWAWADRPPAYLIRKGMRSLKDGLSSAEARTGRSVLLTPGMEWSLQND